MKLDVNKLLVNEMTATLVENSQEKLYFSGKTKKEGDMFCLACLKLESKDDLEIVIDVCDRDIEDGTYFLNSIKTNGKLNMGYFKLQNVVTNEKMQQNINNILNLSTNEEKLENIKGEINSEIEDKNNNK
jgi:hypothetical protein